MDNEEMQEAVEPKPPVLKIALIVVAFLTVVFGIWYFSNGLRGRLASEVATSTASKKKDVAPEISFYDRWIVLTPPKWAGEVYPEKEYIEIDAVQPNLSGTDSTYWTLQNGKGETAPLGLVSTLPLLGKINATGPLSIQARDHLIVSTGRSPIGVSFRVNSCMAYLEQFQDFIPPLDDQCPSVSEIDYGMDEYTALDRNCKMFIRNVPRCRANTAPLPPGTSTSCKSFVESKLSYNGCVASHKNDADFYLPEWRIFLGREKEFWGQPKDTITLLDNKGRIIDTLKY